MTRREWFIVILLTTLGAALRLFQIGAQSLWLDELFSVFLSRKDLPGIVAGTAQDIAPPLYYFLLHAVLQFGADETAVRMTSAFFSIVTIPLFYGVARGLFDRRVALVAAGMLALNPFQIYFAQEARMYSQLAFFVLAAIFFFQRAWIGGHARDWVGFVVAMVLAFYTHGLAFLNLAALDAMVLLASAQARARWKQLVEANLVIAIAFSPWGAAFLQQTNRVQTEFVGTQTPLLFFTTPYLFIFSNVAPTWLVPFALFASLALLAFALLAVTRSIASGSREAFGLAIALVILLVPMVMLYVVSWVYPIFVERRLLPSSFGLYLLLAWAIVNAKPRALNVSIAIVIFSVTLGALGNYYFNSDTFKPPMRQAAQSLVGQYRMGDQVVHTSDSSALAFMYYAPALPNEYLAGDSDYVNNTNRGRAGRIAGLTPVSRESIPIAQSRVWLVVALDHNNDYQLRRVQEFDMLYNREQVLDVGGISLILFKGKP